MTICSIMIEDTKQPVGPQMSSDTISAFGRLMEQANGR